MFYILTVCEKNVILCNIHILIIIIISRFIFQCVNKTYVIFILQEPRMKPQTPCNKLYDMQLVKICVRCKAREVSQRRFALQACINWFYVFYVCRQSAMLQSSGCLRFILKKLKKKTNKPAHVTLLRYISYAMWCLVTEM